MSYALVSAGAPSPSLAPGFGAATGAGHLLVAWAYGNPSSAGFPFATAAPGWALATPGGGAFDWCGIWYKPSSAAGEAPPVFTDSGGGSAYETLLAEFAGAPLAAPLDQSGNGGSAGGTVQVATAGAPDTAGGNLIIGCGGWNGGVAGGGIASTATDGTSSPVALTSYDNAGASNFFFNFTWGIAGAAGTHPDAVTGTLSGGFSNGGCCIATFLAAAAPPAGTPLPAPAGTYDRPHRRRRLIW